ncbi:hypothetical protein ACFPMF_09590 [Larkinella bovis]|uniref:Anti-sigma factor n=1 Tax=Larkinella bovis TaxID=683041 RepID=A0ABW0I813_9BACT
MDIRHYIDSGILEAYLLGLTSEEEQNEVEQMKLRHPEISAALNEIEIRIESCCLENAVPPPPGAWDVIQARTSHSDLKKRAPNDSQNKKEAGSDKSGYVEAEVRDSYIRVHKLWRIAFLIVFILSKIFLIAGLYYYFKSDSQQQEIERLKTVLQQPQTAR